MKKYTSDEYNLSALIDYIDEVPIWSAPFGMKILDMINYRSNISALDIGFGTGYPLLEIAMRLRESSVVYGLDPWIDAVRRTERKMNAYNIKNVRLIEGFAESIPLENDSIDLITSNNGLNNVADIEKSFSECARVIKSGGQFVITMNLQDTMKEFYTTFETVLQEMSLTEEIDKMYDHISQKRPEESRIKQLHDINGFEIREIIKDKFYYHFADGTAFLNHHFIRLAFMDSWFKILPAEISATVFDKIEEILNKKADVDGQITLTIPFIAISSFKK